MNISAVTDEQIECLVTGWYSFNTIKWILKIILKYRFNLLQYDINQYLN